MHRFAPRLAFLALVISLQTGHALAADPPRRSVRSRDVDEQHLKIELSIDLEKQAYRGRAVHMFSPFKPIKSVQLDAGGMKIERVAVGDGYEAETKTLKEQKFELRGEILDIALDREYKTGETFT